MSMHLLSLYMHVTSSMHKLDRRKRDLHLKYLLIQWIGSSEIYRSLMILGGEHAWRRVRVPLDELAGRGHLPSKETRKWFETLQWLDAKCSIDCGITIRMVTAPAYRLKRLIWESTGSKNFKIATLSVIPVRVTAKQNGKKIFCSQMSRKKQKPLIQTTWWEIRARWKAFHSF